MTLMIDDLMVLGRRKESRWENLPHILPRMYQILLIHSALLAAGLQTNQDDERRCNLDNMTYTTSLLIRRVNHRSCCAYGLDFFPPSCERGGVYLRVIVILQFGQQRTLCAGE